MVIFNLRIIIQELRFIKFQKYENDSELFDFYHIIHFF